MIMPLFLAVLFTIITACLYYSARSAAQSAAAACAENSRLLRATERDGRAAAQNVLEAADSLTNTTISVGRGAATTTCTVAGDSNGPLPLLLPPISRTVTMPTEQVTQP